MAAALGKDPKFFSNNAADVHRKINSLLWVGPEEPTDDDWIHQARKNKNPSQARGILKSLFYTAL